MGLIEVSLPILHAGQSEIYRKRTKRNVLRCGRRFGKTKMMVTMAANAAIKGRKVGIFAPEHKQLQEPYDELLVILGPLVSSSNKTDGVIKLITGGKIDFWRLTDNELAGRGREYDLILIDEAAFTKNGQMVNIWNKSIKPTMATKPDAEVFVFSTPNGDDPENFFWKLCNDDKLKEEFREFWAPSIANPLVSKEWLEEERLKNHPDVFRQEYEAEFIDWRGAAFFAEDKLLIDGLPPPFPERVKTVFAVIDTAIKTGKENDGTGVVYYGQWDDLPHPLWILDWDIQQIEGASLEIWLPGVFDRLEELARQTRSIHGSQGAYIEDKASGQILLQQAYKHEWPVAAIDSKLTALGKDERAINASGYVYNGKVKITEPAYHKTMPYKGVTRNHLMTQVTGYRLGNKDPKAQDDLLDCFTYGVSLALGNSDGY